jgi:hypothetical protein
MRIPETLKKYIAESIDELTPNKVVGYIVVFCGIAGFFLKLDTGVTHICIIGGLALCGVADKIDADYYGKRGQ